MTALQPTALEKLGDDRVRFVWNDGRRGTITWSRLRESCPCAVCREERQRPPDPFRVLKENEIPRGPLKPTALVPVGNYAYKAIWNDGHDTGIFPFEALYALCDWEISD